MMNVVDGMDESLFEDRMENEGNRSWREKVGCSEEEGAAMMASENGTDHGCAMHMETGLDRESREFVYRADVETELSQSGEKNIRAEKRFSFADVVDLTGGDSDNEHQFEEKPSTQLVPVKKLGVDETVVWGVEASEKDAVEIERMLRSGAGTYGSVQCKLEVKRSLLSGAGRGVFLKDNCMIRSGECITRYSGQRIRSTKHLSVEEQLRTIQVGELFVVGKKDLKFGDGFASLMNSSVAGRTHSFCRFVSYKNAVYVMASCKKGQYPLIGSIELYLTAGHSWWTLFNSTVNVDG